MQQRWPAALVHLFTASGVVCALFATRALLSGRWEECFAWLGVALVVDGIDGTFARMARVTERLPRFSGERLDLTIDYVTYVFVPVLALLQAGYLPGAAGLTVASLILLSSLFHFSDTASKADDYSFVGFPAVWNVVAFYAFALRMPPWAVTGLSLACIVLTFVPMPWAHPIRTARLWPITLSAVLVWCAAATLAIWQGFPAGFWLQVALVATGIYGVGLALWHSRPG
jgi:phosphatidylcholine synthase